jgi:hypothetical protein
MKTKEFEEVFDMELPGASEEHQYALELIKNIFSVADDLDPDVFAETMLIYTVNYHLASEKGPLESFRNFLTEVLEKTDVQAQQSLLH